MRDGSVDLTVVDGVSDFLQRQCLLRLPLVLLAPAARALPPMTELLVSRRLDWPLVVAAPAAPHLAREFGRRRID